MVLGKDHDSLCTDRSVSDTMCSPQQWFFPAIWQEGKFEAGLQYAKTLFKI